MGALARAPALVALEVIEPEAPTRKTNSPLSMESDRFSSAVTSGPYDFVTPSRMTIGPSPGRSTDRRSERTSDEVRTRARSRARRGGVSGEEGVGGASVLMETRCAGAPGGAGRAAPPPKGPSAHATAA